MAGALTVAAAVVKAKSACLTFASRLIRSESASAILGITFAAGQLLAAANDKACTQATRAANGCVQLSRAQQQAWWQQAHTGAYSEFWWTGCSHTVLRCGRCSPMPQWQQATPGAVCTCNSGSEAETLHMC